MDKILTYTIHLEPADEGGYTVTVPALPAVVTEGDTYDEAIAMAEEAILLYIEHCIAEGREVPNEAPSAAPLDTRIRINAPATR